MTVSIPGVDIPGIISRCACFRWIKKRSRTVRSETQGFAALDKWLAKHEVGQLHDSMEATCRDWEELAPHWHQTGYTVIVVNPACIHNCAKGKPTRTNTDKQDAKVIAEYAETQQPAAWRPLRPDVWEVHALVRHLEDLQNMRT